MLFEMTEGNISYLWDERQVQRQMLHSQVADSAEDVSAWD